MIIHPIFLVAMHYLCYFLFTTYGHWCCLTHCTYTYFFSSWSCTVLSCTIHHPSAFNFNIFAQFQFSVLLRSVRLRHYRIIEKVAGHQLLLMWECVSSMEMNNFKYLRIPQPQSYNVSTITEVLTLNRYLLSLMLVFVGILKATGGKQTQHQISDFWLATADMTSF